VDEGVDVGAKVETEPVAQQRGGRIEDWVGGNEYSGDGDIGEVMHNMRMFTFPGCCCKQHDNLCPLPMTYELSIVTYLGNMPKRLFSEES
jgi:hypothetical protein